MINLAYCQGSYTLARRGLQCRRPNCLSHWS